MPLLVVVVDLVRGVVHLPALNQDRNSVGVDLPESEGMVDGNGENIARVNRVVCGHVATLEDMVQAN